MVFRGSEILSIRPMLRLGLLMTGIFLAINVSADTNSVFVNGAGTVNIVPNFANINLSVVTKSKDAQTARKKNAEEVARLSGLLKDKFKIDAKEIQTSQFDLSPDYRYEQNGKTILNGFQVTHSLKVKLKQIDKVGEVIDKVTVSSNENRMLNVQGVEFDSDERQSLELKALEAAMADAGVRARVLAKSAGKNLGGVVNISDTQANNAGPLPMFRASFVETAADESAATTAVSPGQIQITAKVSVEYELK